MEKPATYSVKQASEKLQVSAKILRSLCNSGLIPHVRRNRLGHRVLQDWQINHAHTLLGLRAAGFTKSGLKRYARLVRQGRQTLPERKAMFETQKRQLWQELDATRNSIDFLERQIEAIDQ